MPNYFKCILELEQAISDANGDFGTSFERVVLTHTIEKYIFTTVSITVGCLIIYLLRKSGVSGFIPYVVISLQIIDCILIFSVNTASQFHENLSIAQNFSLMQLNFDSTFIVLFADFILASGYLISTLTMIEYKHVRWVLVGGCCLAFCTTVYTVVWSIYISGIFRTFINQHSATRFEEISVFCALVEEAAVNNEKVEALLQQFYALVVVLSLFMLATILAMLVSFFKLR